MKCQGVNISRKILLFLVLLFLGLMSASVTHALIIHPINTETYNFVTKWGSYGSGDGQFVQSYSLAVDSSGNVYVADHPNARVEKFDKNGNYLTKWSYSVPGGGLMSPFAIAVDSSGYVYVADPTNECIEKFDSNGGYIAKWGSKGTGNGQFSQPSGVAIDSSGNIYVTDSSGLDIQPNIVYKIPLSPSILKQQRIEVFDKNGKYMNQWGSNGSNSGQLYGPTGVAVDSSGNVYVADTGNNRIQKFDSHGHFVTQWSSLRPEGIAVDSWGNVYVTSADRDEIQKFNYNGYFITQWGPYGSGDGQFFDAFGVAVDSLGGIVYVTDGQLARVQKFTKQRGTPIIFWNKPADITYGTPLNDKQLDATALIMSGIRLLNVPGTFVYTPTAGTLLSVGTHTLHVDFYPTDTASYNSTSEDITINVSENVTFNVVGANYKCSSWPDKQYPSINLLGENYVPLLDNINPIWKSHVDKLSKLVLDSKEVYALKTGDKLDLGQDYSLTAKQVDVDGKKVWLELDKDGQYVDDQVVSTDSGDHTWTSTLNNIQGVNNVSVLKVHVNKVFQGAVDSIAQIDGIWLIDYANTTNFKIGDQLGNSTIVNIIPGVDAFNLGGLVLRGS